MQLQERKIKHRGSSLVCIETKNSWLQHFAKALHPGREIRTPPSISSLLRLKLYPAICFRSNREIFASSVVAEAVGDGTSGLDSQQPDALALFPDCGRGVF